MSFSIFYGRGSAGNVRGKQVAELIGAKQNPTSGYEYDTCIYVKITPPPNRPKRAYLDIDDSTKALEYLKTDKEIGLIATSVLQQEYLSKELGRKDIIIIPHIHPNYDNWRRPERPIKTAGIIGSKTSFMYPIPEIRKKLEAVGLDLIYEEDYWKAYGDEPNMTENQRRLKVVDFYKQVDIQIVWSKGAFTDRVERMKNPNKLINAASFGIPTISYPSLHYIREWREYFVEVESIDEMVFKAGILKNQPAVYQSISNTIFDYAKKYHKDIVKELYLEL